MTISSLGLGHSDGGNFGRQGLRTLGRHAQEGGGEEIELFHGDKEMSEPERNQHHPLLARFSFEEFSHWHAPPNHKDDFAERRAADCADNADTDAKHGFNDRANEEKAKAFFWRGLKHLQEEEGSRLDAGAWLDASEHIDVLLERAKLSVEAMRSLFHLSQQIHEGLNALAAKGHAGAAAALLDSLSFAANDFVGLATCKPKLFINDTRHRHHVPGLISQSPETTTANVRLVESLEVGKTHRIRLRADSVQGRNFSVISTRSNFWAARLIEYIAMARIVLPVKIGEQEIVMPASAKWERAALALNELSTSNNLEWFQVAWEIVMDVTHGKPELEPHLMSLGASAARKQPKYCKTLHPRTQASNVRAKIKGNLKEAFKKLAWQKSPQEPVS